MKLPGPRLAAIALLLLFLNTDWCSAQAEAIFLNKSTYLLREQIVAGFTGGPGNPKDWIAIYPAGVEPGPVPPGGSPFKLWQYVDGTSAGTVGLSEGSVTFPTGLNQAGHWVAYLLLNDGYTKVAQAEFQTVERLLPVIGVDRPVYAPGESISVAFTNGPANPKDWIAIFPTNRPPGIGVPALWRYVDGTPVGTTGRSEGVITFAAGLRDEGSYAAYLLENDSNTILVSALFAVARSADGAPRLLRIEPPNAASNVVPVIQFVAVISDGLTHLRPESVELAIDDTAVNVQLAQEQGVTTLTYTNAALLPANTTHTYRLSFADDGQPPATFVYPGSFVVAPYRELSLPPPLYFEDFDSTEEGKLPSGWSSLSYSATNDAAADLQDLNSNAYADWLVVDRERFTKDFRTYDSHDLTSDYARVLAINPLNVVNGAFIENMIAGRFVFGNSGYRDGGYQYLVLTTPDFDLSGQSNIVLSFHSIWEQNQDSIGAVEYSIDQGHSWRPIVYYLDPSDVVTNEAGHIDAIATFSNARPDIARYPDPVTGEPRGGSYGAFIGARVASQLALFISPRPDDDPVASKRVESFHLYSARLQSHVRFRFAHAGTDSWYFGIDNLPIVPGLDGEPVSLSAIRAGDQVTISWPPDVPGFTLEESASLSEPDWTAVEGATNNSVTLPVISDERFYQLTK
ncbi:MAG: hypothetical protein U1G07_03390 [Verrucomicrobiota bacterium]